MSLRITRAEFFAAIAAVLLALTTCSQAQTTVVYQPTSEDMANPERGLFQYDDDRKGKQEPLDEGTLRANRDNKYQTVVYRHYTLVDFKAKPISDKYLLFLKQDAAIARQAGVKMIVRFAYEEKFHKCKPNNEGASSQQVLSHLKQLADYFRVNSDVIVLVEAGLIGTYGEWFYGNTDFGYCEHPNYTTRAAVLWQLLEIVPATLKIALRAPFHKRAVIEEWKKQGKPAGAIETFAKRIGYHNDGFLADESDLGTFPAEADRVQMADDSRTTPTLGETSVNSLKPGDNPYAAWVKAREQLARYHWILVSGTDDGLVFTAGYICKDGTKWKKWEGETNCKNKTLIDRWTAEQKADFRGRLGYRFVLLKGTYPQKAKSNNEIELSFEIENEGFANLFNERSVLLVLRNAKNDEQRIFELKDLDPRRWGAQEISKITTKIKLNSGGSVPPGDYDLYLYLPDPAFNANACANNICNPADYAIRFANENLWELAGGKATGYNRLQHRLVVE